MYYIIDKNEYFYRFIDDVDSVSVNRICKIFRIYMIAISFYLEVTKER